MSDQLQMVLFFVGAILVIRFVIFPIYMFYIKIKVFQTQKVINEWGMIIEGGGNYLDTFYEKVQNLIEAQQVSMIEARLAPFKGLSLFSEKREYVHVTNTNLGEFRIFVGARPYGDHLDVSWYATIKPSFLKRLIVWELKLDMTATLVLCQTLFEKQDLRAYMTTVHHCVKQAVQEIMQEVGQDPTKIGDGKSKGYLEIW